LTVFSSVIEGTRKSMRANRSCDTKPELTLRLALYREGFRGYRKNCRALAGKPDIVFIRKRVCIFVNGCFWHGCERCATKRNLRPASNAAYWEMKVARTIKRDHANAVALQNAGWEVIVVWECEVKADLERQLAKLRQILTLAKSSRLAMQRHLDEFKAGSCSGNKKRQALA
jgi:DNA mismatch endonuclease, patch repair protein